MIYINNDNHDQSINNRLLKIQNEIFKLKSTIEIGNIFIIFLIFIMLLIFIKILTDIVCILT